MIFLLYYFFLPIYRQLFLSKYVFQMNSNKVILKLILWNRCVFDNLKRERLEVQNESNGPPLSWVRINLQFLGFFLDTCSTFSTVCKKKYCFEFLGKVLSIYLSTCYRLSRTTITWRTVPFHLKYLNLFYISKPIELFK